MGWKIHRHYTDNDVSAYKEVLRPAFEDLVLDLEDGVIDGIVVYDLDRLARRIDDLERLIKIYDRAKDTDRRLVFRTVHDSIDLSSPDGITMARVMVAFANKSSRDTSRRVAAQRRSLALTGAPVGGTRPFGWDWQRDPIRLPDGTSTPGPRRHVVNDLEAGEIRRLARELLDGASINALVRDLNEREVRTPRNNEWKAMTLKQMLMSARLAGYRIHRGEVLINTTTKEWVRGRWVPILDDATWMALVERLTDSGDESERRAEPQRSYLLSGILRCSQCQGPLHGNARTETHWYYACKLRGGAAGAVGCGKISASGLAVDMLVEALMKERLADRELEYEVSTAWGREGDLTLVKQKIRALLEAFSSQEGDAAAEALVEVSRLNADAELLRAERTQWLKDRGTRRVRARVTTANWDELTLADKRAYIRGELEALWVMPATKRGNRFDAARLIPAWRPT